MNSTAVVRRTFSLRFILLVFLLAGACAPSIAQTLRVDSLFSLSLGRLKKFTVLVPSQTKRMPVLVLLHGHGGDNNNWVTLSGVAQYVKGTPLLVVMPDGENSWYVNQLGKPGGRFEDFIVNDLLTHIRLLYPVDTTRIAIAGFSMGGYGALILGMRHPQVFSFIGALSASLDVPYGIPDLEKHKRMGLHASLVRAFGAGPSEFWLEHDPFALVAALSPGTAPYLYLANGIQDEFADRLPLYRAFADSVRAHGLPYEYRETPGKHDWDYCDHEIRSVVTRLLEVWKLK